MNIERLQMKGLLSDSKKKYKKLDYEASGLIILIRSYLFPHEEDVTRLKVDKALFAAEKLNNTVEEMKELKAKIKSLEVDLG